MSEDVIAKARERQSREDAAEIMAEVVRRNPAEALVSIDNDPQAFLSAFDEAEAALKVRRTEQEAKALSAGDGRALRQKLRLKEKAPTPPKQEPDPSSEELRQGSLMEDVRRSGGSTDAVARYLQFQEKKRR